MFVRQLRKAASGCALGKRGVVTISPEVTSFLQTNTTKVNWSKFKHLCSSAKQGKVIKKWNNDKYISVQQMQVKSWLTSNF